MEQETNKTVRVFVAIPAVKYIKLDQILTKNRLAFSQLMNQCVDLLISGGLTLTDAKIGNESVFEQIALDRLHLDKLEIDRLVRNVPERKIRAENTLAKAKKKKTKKAKRKRSLCSATKQKSRNNRRLYLIDKIYDSFKLETALPYSHDQ